MSLEGIHVSDLNFSAAVRAQLNLPAKVGICDCTLREGEQAAEVSFGLKDKLALARRMAELGVHRIQAGYPGRSEIDKQTAQILKREGIPAEIDVAVQVFLDDWREQIDAAIESEADTIGLIYPASDLRLQYVQKHSREQMIERSIETIEYTRSQGGVVGFGPTDSTRADLEFFIKVCKAAEKAGASSIGVADTAGAVGPAAMRYLVGEVVKAVSIPIGVHCHDDCGLALANTLAGIEAGAQEADATVNGLGERAGNTALDELVTVLTVMYGFDLGIKLEGLCALSREVEALSGVMVPQSKALVGQYAFAHKLDAHVKGVLLHPPVYEPIRPELVGNRRFIPIGKYSGPYILRHKLGELGLAASDEQLVRLTTAVEAAAIEKRAALSDDELKTLALRIIG